MRGLIRNEGSVEQVKEAIDIAKAVIDCLGIKLEDSIPSNAIVCE
jgi:hypothetical protein